MKSDNSFQKKCLWHLNVHMFQTNVRCTSELLIQCKNVIKIFEKYISYLFQQNCYVTLSSKFRKILVLFRSFFLYFPILKMVYNDMLSLYQNFISKTTRYMIAYYFYTGFYCCVFFCSVTILSIFLLGIAIRWWGQSMPPKRLAFHDNLVFTSLS